MERPLLYKDLFEIISDQEYLEENAACYYFKQLVSIVINCQKQGVIHRSVSVRRLDSNCPPSETSSLRTSWSISSQTESLS